MIHPMIQLLAQSSVPLDPTVILALCAVAGVGTVLLLPSRREAPLRIIGGIILLTAGLVFAALLVRWAVGNAAWGAASERIYFWIFSAIALIGSVRVVTHTKPVYSALYFVLTVFATAGLFLLLWAEFMAAALVLIYAGAILITYVFVIMLAAEAAPGQGSTAASHQTGALAGLAEHDAVSRDPLIACAIGFALMGVLLFVIFDKYQALGRQGELPPPIQSAEVIQGPDEAPADSLAPPVEKPPVLAGSTQQLGAFLFTNQLINLELAGLILTIAMVGAIVIARRQVIDQAGQTVPDEAPSEVVIGPATPQTDDPHSIPVYGTTNPRQKAYPER